MIDFEYYRCSQPVLLWQQALNEDPSSAIYRDADALIAAGRVKLSLGIFSTRTLTSSRDPCLSTLTVGKQVSQYEHQ